MTMSIAAIAMLGEIRPESRARRGSALIHRTKPWVPVVPTNGRSDAK
jgi:hypothetical protein